MTLRTNTLSLSLLQHQHIIQFLSYQHIDDKETASIKKDAEIEKLKGVVINLTGVREKYKEQRLRDPVKVDFFVAMYNKFKRGLP